MTRQPSTIRTSNQRTIEDPFSSTGTLDAVDCIVRYWREEAGASVLRTCEAFPSLALNRSLLLDLAVEEFKAKSNESGIDAQSYCKQFQGFGSNLEQSLYRAIEVQEYLNRHPELLEVVVDFQWPAPGETLQGFEVIEELGRGAIARVYLCRDSGLAEREVVVKVARGDGYEAELLARLDHPNVVPIYSVVNDRQKYVTCICMPFRGRRTLQDVVDCITGAIPQSGSVILAVARNSGVESDNSLHNTSPRSRCADGYVDSVICLAVTLADALSHAHRVGVLHGDLKPSNVLLTDNGEPLLIDFNLARDQRSDAAPRGGTLAYMPPELLRSIADESLATTGSYDVRSEVFSFGALLFQLLTGRLPYQLGPNANDACAIAGHLLGEQGSSKPSIREHNPRVNDSLERLVVECLAADPSGRPRTMAEVCQRLHRQTTLLPRIGRHVLQRQKQSLISMSLALAVVIGSMTYLISRPRYHVRQFENGIACQRQNDFSTAITFFSEAMNDDALRRVATYQRATSYIKNNEPSLAISDFSQVFRDYEDRQSAAEIGYCFNLLKDHDAAIHWYEKALAAGFESAELHNNLGFSYAICKSHVDHIERFRRAIHHLRLAIEMEDGLVAARFNLMTATLLRSDPLGALEADHAAGNVEELLQFKSHDKLALTLAALIYGRVSTVDRAYADRCAEISRRAVDAGAGPTRHELLLSPSFAVLRSHERFSSIFDRACESRQTELNLRAGMFLDPVSTTVALAASH